MPEIRLLPDARGAAPTAAAAAAWRQDTFHFPQGQAAAAAATRQAAPLCWLQAAEAEPWRRWEEACHGVASGLCSPPTPSAPYGSYVVYGSVRIHTGPYGASGRAPQEWCVTPQSGPSRERHVTGAHLNTHSVATDHRAIFTPSGREHSDDVITRYHAIPTPAVATKYPSIPGTARHSSPTHVRAQSEPTILTRASSTADTRYIVTRSNVQRHRRQSAIGPHSRAGLKHTHEAPSPVAQSGVRSVYPVLL